MEPIYGTVTCLGNSLLQPYKRRKKFRSVVLRRKLFPPGSDYHKIFRFGRHHKNDFILWNKKGEKEDIHPWISRFHFSILAHADLLQCFLLNGSSTRNSQNQNLATVCGNL